MAMADRTNDIFSGLEDLFGDFNTTNVANEQGVTAVPVATPVEDTNAVNFMQTNVSAVNAQVTAAALAKMKMIETEMNQLYVERDEVIRAMMLAVTTGQSLLMLGMPGTAKSALTYELCSRIENGQYFQWMLNKTSDPSELLGPYSIKQMEQDKFLRITTGKLPEAHIAFIDECYKANAPVLNILLPIMNEKIFYNDGKPNPIPLITMIGASNEPPEDDSLKAFHDRFLFRLNVEYVKDAGNKKRMYTNYIDGRAGLLNLAQKASITIDELKMLNDATKSVRVPKDVVNKFIKFINDLNHEGIFVSDRRQNECFRIMQGAALLAGRQQVGLDDFKALVYVLWEKLEEIPKIESIILKMVNPYDDKFKEFRENFRQIQSGIDAASDQTEKARKSLEAKGAIDKLASKVNKLINEASKNGKDVTEYTTFRNEIVNYGNQMVAAALGQSGLGSGIGNLFGGSASSNNSDPDDDGNIF